MPRPRRLMPIDSSQRRRNRLRYHGQVFVVQGGYVDAAGRNGVNGKFALEPFNLFLRQSGEGEHAALLGDEGEISRYAFGL